MSNFSKFKYNQNINHIRYDTQKITEAQFINSAKSIFKLNTNNKSGFKKLNRLNNAIIINDASSEKVIKRAEKSGYFKLNGFVNVYRKTIKISYCTLYQRINKNTTLKQFLIDNNYIFCFSYKDLTGYKGIKGEQNYNKENIIVNYEKRYEFIALILKSFLSENQRNNEV